MLATPIMAACRPESALAIGDIIDLKATQVKRVAADEFTIFFVLKTTQGFVCGGNGGVNKLPAGCTKDGFSYRPELSTNVRAAIQAPSCYGFTVASVNQAGVRAAFRIRYEEGKQSPKRRTFVIAADLSGAFTGPGPLPFTAKAVPDPDPAE